jgi:hypothetical protein
MSVIRQPSLFGADASPPEPGDLAGLLAAGGTVAGHLSGHSSGARVSIIVDHPWRAATLVGECARRGIPATSVATPDDHIAVRTVYSPALAPLAAAWTVPGDAPSAGTAAGDPMTASDPMAAGIATGGPAIVGAAMRTSVNGATTTLLPPRDLRLDGRALRLWVLARGRSDGPGTYRLPVGPDDEPDREPIWAALAALGLGPQLVRARGAAHASYRIVGSRRVNRLLELVGDPPDRTPPDIWPR